MVVAGAATRAIGIWTPELGIITPEGEEGVVVGIDNLTGAEELVVGETHNVHQGTHHTRNKVVYKTTLLWPLRAVSAIRTANNRATVVLWGNGVTAHL